MTSYPQKLTSSRTGKLALTLVLAAIPLANAQTVVDDFESYSTGSFTDGTGGWSVSSDARYSTSSADVLSSGLSYSQNGFNIDGGDRSLQLTYFGDGTTDPSADFVGKNFAATTASTIYVRYLLKFDGGSTSFSTFGFSGNGFSQDSSAALVPSAGGLERIRAYNTSGDRTSLDNLDLIDGTNTNLVVGKIEFDGAGNETFSIVFNPTSTDEGSIVWDTVSHDMGVTGFDYFGSYGNRNNNALQFTLDEIVVGTSWNQVTAIPEPSSIALMGLAVGALTLLNRRRRS